MATPYVSEFLPKWQDVVRSSDTFIHDMTRVELGQYLPKQMETGL